MGGLLEGLRRFYDWIVIDTPPVGAVSEPLILAPMTDGAVVVAAAEMVPRKAVLHTLERIHETGARILGVVLNRAQVDKHSYYYSHYYGHYYGRYYGTGTGKTGGHAAARTTTADARLAGKVTSIGATRARA
jgi:Mrp family chromosome partitioning ATPase